MPASLKLDADGWIAQATACPSPNHDDRPNGCSIELAVIHGISLPPGKFGGNEIELLFTNRSDDDAFADLKVSAHFLIRRTGELVQFVSCSKRAWHAGESNWQGRTACNDFSIGIELEGTDDLPYEHIQYQALANLLQAAQDQYPQLTSVVGHSDIAPGRKTDPGDAFDWNALASLVGSAFALADR